MKTKKKVNNNKLRYKIFFLGLIFILIISLIGVSFSYWRFESKQNDKNIASSKCFKVTITNESDAITLTNMHPITDEEGLKSSSYSFTIENTCDTYAMYQVNLEDILDDTITKRLNNKYIKISLNDGTPKVLNTYQSVTPTINNADASFKLTSGSLGPKGSNNDSVNYNLKLWMNYDTPALDEVMSATFKSKISVVSVYTEEDKLTNDITITYNTKATDYTKDSETIDINATSTNYNLIEYSTDNITYTSIDTPSKNVKITKTYTEDKDETIYFRDEIGNLKSEKVVLSKLDKTGPVITVSASSDWGSSNTISITLEDEKSGLAGYALTETETEPSEWTSITGKSTTITKEVTSNKKYYVYVKDVLGNISHKEVAVSHVDTSAPTIVSLTEQSSYGATSTITAVAKDTESGITGYAFTESSIEPTNWTSVDNVITESTYTYKASKNGTIYFWVKDGAGHATNKAITVSKVDVTAPTVTFSLSDETTWTKSKTLTMNFSDNDSGLAGYAVTTTETTPTTWTSISETSISKTQTITTNGTYYVWVKDNRGLINNVNILINKIDALKPQIDFDIKSDGGSIEIDASKSVDNESGIAKYEYSIDDKNYYSSNVSLYNFTELESGNYTVYVRATDNVGNIGVLSKKYTVTGIYTVSYNANGGNGSMSTDTISYGKDYTAKSNTFTRTGYTFAGWNEKVDGTGSDWTSWIGKPWTWTYKKSITLYAKWKPNTYTISYNANGGSGSMSTDTISYGEDYTAKSNTFTRTGYTFAGWNENSSGTGTDWTSWIGKPWTWAYTKNITLYAKWKANTYTVSYNANGGSGTMSTDTISYGSDYTAKANTFTRPGYTFAGWNENASGTGTDWTSWIGKPWTWTYTKDITLYAKWVPSTLDIFPGNSMTPVGQSGYSWIRTFSQSSSQITYTASEANYSLASVFYSNAVDITNWSKLTVSFKVTKRWDTGPGWGYISFGFSNSLKTSNPGVSNYYPDYCNYGKYWPTVNQTTTLTLDLSGKTGSKYFEFYVAATNIEIYNVTLS